MNDIITRLEDYAADGGYSHCDYADTMRQAADALRTLTAPPPLRIYIAGPMSGIPDLNFPAFHAKAAELRAAGYVAINPAEINGGADEQIATAAMSPEELAAHWQKCMRKDITALCTCDGIAMLDGWTKSRGATLEHHVAKALGLLVIEAGA